MDRHVPAVRRPRDVTAIDQPVHASADEVQHQHRVVLAVHRVRGNSQVPAVWGERQFAHVAAGHRIAAHQWRGPHPHEGEEVRFAGDAAERQLRRVGRPCHHQRDAVYGPRRPFAARHQRRVAGGRELRDPVGHAPGRQRQPYAIGQSLNRRDSLSVGRRHGLLSCRHLAVARQLVVAAHANWLTGRVRGEQARACHFVGDRAASRQRRHGDVGDRGCGRRAVGAPRDQHQRASNHHHGAHRCKRCPARPNAPPLNRDSRCLCHRPALQEVLNDLHRAGAGGSRVTGSSRRSPSRCGLPLPAARTPCHPRPAVRDTRSRCVRPAQPEPGGR